MTPEPEANTDEDETPLVLLARLGDLGALVPEPIRKIFRDRPIWFLLEMDQELVSIFERLPEDPIQKGHVTAIFGAIRAFAERQNPALQALLGVTDSIQYGFHTDAPYDRVRASFEEDGFEVLEGIIEDGDIKDADEGDGATPEPETKK